MSFSDDLTSPAKKKRAHTNHEPRESPQDFSFLSSKETEKQILNQELHETSRSSVFPNKEALKSRHGSFSDYFERNNITMNTENMLNPFGVGGSFVTTCIYIFSSLKSFTSCVLQGLLILQRTWAHKGILKRYR